MNDREAFKVAFLSRCVEENMAPEEMLSLVKAATEKAAFLGTVVGKGMDAAKMVLGKVLGAGVPTAILAPPIVGGLAGYGLARATDIDDVDIAEIRDKELLEEYQKQTDALRRTRATRDYQKARKQTGRMFN